MKIRILLLGLIWASSCLTLIADDVIVQSLDRERPVHYAAVKLGQALKSRGHSVVASSKGSQFVVELKTVGEGPAEGYHIRRQREGDRIFLRVEGNDDRGTLYGTLALIESLENGTPLAELQATSATARFPFRAIKFNLPWYSYRAGEALALHDRTCRDLAFREAFLDSTP